MSGTDLLYEERDRIATLTFNRPGARNALTWEMYDGLLKAFERIDASEHIRVAVLRGANTPEATRGCGNCPRNCAAVRR